MLDAQTCLQLYDHAGGTLPASPCEFWTEAHALLIVGFVGQYLIGFGSLWWLGT